MTEQILTPEEDKLFERFIKMGETCPTAKHLAELDLTLAEYLEMWDNECEYADDEYLAELDRLRSLDAARSMFNTWLKSQQ